MNACARLLVAATLAAGSASAQGTFVYELEIEVYENTIVDPISFPDLAALTVGTTGTMRTVVDAQVGDYPDWITDQTAVYDILEVTLDVGDIHTRGSIYPSMHETLGLQITNDGWLNYNFRTRMDFFGCLLLFEHPETALSSIVIRDVSEPNEIPILFSSTDLPTSANLSLAEDRNFNIRSLDANNQDVSFRVTFLEGTYVADCPADVNQDEMLTPQDFTAWLAAFSTMSQGCDQNGDGNCTPADFTAWIANYSTGCP